MQIEKSIGLKGEMSKSEMKVKIFLYRERLLKTVNGVREIANRKIMRKCIPLLNGFYWKGDRYKQGRENLRQALKELKILA